MSGSQVQPSISVWRPRTVVFLMFGMWTEQGGVGLVPVPCYDDGHTGGWTSLKSFTFRTHASRVHVVWVHAGLTQTDRLAHNVASDLRPNKPRREDGLDFTSTHSLVALLGYDFNTILTTCGKGKKNRANSITRRPLHSTVREGRYIVLYSSECTFGKRATVERADHTSGPTCHSGFYGTHFGSYTRNSW